MKIQSKKLISLILAVVLVLGVFPMAGFATGEEDPIEPPAITQTSEGQTGDDTATPTPAGQDETATPTPVGQETATPTPVGQETATPTPVASSLPATPTPTPTPTPKAAVLADLSGEELYAYLLKLTGDELHETLAMLNDTQITSLDGIMTADHALAWFGIVPFTSLALGANNVLFDAPTDQVLDDVNLVLGKTAVYNGNDTATIQLTAYAKGNLQSIGKPADIVLVLDQSYSMDSVSGNFGAGYKLTTSYTSGNTYVRVNGTYKAVTKVGSKYYYDGIEFNLVDMQLYTFSNTMYRIDALETAVMNFWLAVKEKTTDAVQNRIAIVGFSNSASYLTGTSSNRFVDARADLRTTINNLSNNLPSGTQTDLGMQYANALFNDQIPEDRNRIVILFTDGEPRSASSESDSVVIPIIRNALSAAREMKTTKGVTIFSVGIGVSSLDPNRLPLTNSSRDQNTFLHCISSNYPNAQMNTTTTITYSRMTGGLGSATYYIFDYTGPAESQPSGNRREVYKDGSIWYYGSGADRVAVTFLSNGNTPQSGNSYHFWKITSEITTEVMVPGDRSEVYDADDVRINFYKTAASSSDLDSVFQGVSETLTGGISDITIKDFLMPQFEGIMNGSTLINITATIGSTSVPFSYNPDSRLLTVGPVRLDPVEMKGDEPDPAQLAVKQLVITWTVNVKSDFIGGNNVLTNDSGSGAYDTEGPVEYFTEPVVNIPLEYDPFELTDQHVYLGDGALITDFFVTDEYSIDEIPYQYNGDNNGYVNIVYTIKLKDSDTVVGTYTVPYGDATGEFEANPGYSNTLTNLTQDTWYTITATIAPVSDGDEDNGEPATPKILDDMDDTRADIFVYKPIVTTRNVAVYLTDNPTDEELTANAIDSVSWMHDTTNANSVTMTEDTAPGLDYTFAYVIPPVGYLTETTQVNITGINTMRGNPAAVTATLTDSDLTERVSPFYVYVMKPIVTCVDGEMFLGDSAITWSDYFNDFDKSWSAQPANTTLIGDDEDGPDIDLMIDLPAPAPAGASATGFNPIVVGSHDFTIMIKVNGQDVTAYSDILNDTTTVTPTRHFIIAVIAGTLTITKDVATDGPNAVKDGECFLFTITGPAGTIRAVIQGAGETKITGLPKGTYTVTEDTDWSWRYNTTVVNQTGGKVLGKVGTAYITAITASVSNTDRTPFWLSGESSAVNKFAPYAG